MTTDPAPDTYDRLEAAIQDWIREQGDDTLVLTDWVLSASGIDMHTADDRIEYYAGGSGAPHSVLGLADLAVLDAKKRFEGDDE